MSQSFKKFLAEDGAGLAPGAGQFLALAAFGKHPGWDDHVEDLGLETETLIVARQVLYVQGVGGEIDTGAWEKLDPAHRAEGFNHVFLWQRGGQFLVGRMWSSSDGKGRTRYPMVVCAHYGGAAMSWGLQRALPKLEELEQACKAAATADGVKAALERARSGLRATLGNTTGDGAYTPAPESLNRFVSAPAFGADRTGWYRIMYQIQSQMAAYAPGKFSARDDLAQMRPQHMRVPAPGFPDEAMLLWTRFLAGRIDRNVPVLAIHAKDRPWLDLVIGQPGKEEFFCLRALPAALPLATDVPYDLDQKFKDQARRELAEFESGKKPEADGSDAETSSKWVSITQRFFKGTKLFLWIGGGLVALASAGVLLHNLNHGGSASPPPQQVAAAAESAQSPVAGRAGPAIAGLPAVAAPQQVAATPTPASAPPSAPPSAQPPPSPQGPAVVSTGPRAPPPEITSPAPAPVAPPAAPQTAPSSSPSSSPATIAQSVPPAAPTVTVSSAVAPAVVTAVQSNALLAAPPAGAGRAFTNGIGMVLLWVAALPGAADGAWVGKYEVTQAQFQQVMGANPSASKNDLQPVESVTWQEASDFCRKLTASEKSGGTLPQGFAYMLPTQAQWDGFLDDAGFDDAVTSRAAPRTTPAPVGSVGKPNSFGLCDVLGNVWEWCADDAGPQRILTGGAYDSTKIFQWKPMQRTSVLRLPADKHAPNAGFRCLLAQDNSPPLSAR
jgi:hypothetical protein